MAVERSRHSFREHKKTNKQDKSPIIIKKSSASISWVKTKATIKTFVSIRRLLQQALSSLIHSVEKVEQPLQNKNLFS
jgi:hypothetical protein